jgi:hypothetical protein
MKPEQVIQKKGSASKLVSINQKLSDSQKERICEVGFGDLLKLKCPNVPKLLVNGWCQFLIWNLPN